MYMCTRSCSSVQPNSTGKLVTQSLFLETFHSQCLNVEILFKYLQQWFYVFSFFSFWKRESLRVLIIDGQEESFFCGKWINVSFNFVRGCLFVWATAELWFPTVAQLNRFEASHMDTVVAYVNARAKTHTIHAHPTHTTHGCRRCCDNKPLLSSWCRAVCTL